MPLPTFGAGSTLGPLGNAGPATASTSSQFSPVFGEVQFGGGSGTAQAVVPWVVIGAVAVIGIGAWYLAQR